MSVLEREARDRDGREVTSEVVSCPDCDRPAGVPVPARSTVVDDAENADGESPTCCPSCDTYFDVYYALDSAS